MVFGLMEGFVLNCPSCWICLSFAYPGSLPLLLILPASSAPTFGLVSWWFSLFGASSPWPVVPLPLTGPPSPWLLIVGSPLFSWWPVSLSSRKRRKSTNGWLPRVRVSSVFCSTGECLFVVLLVCRPLRPAAVQRPSAYRPLPSPLPPILASSSSPPLPTALSLTPPPRGLVSSPASLSSR